MRPLHIRPLALAIGAISMSMSVGLAPVLAADFKGKKVEMVIGNSPGGGTDGAGRLVAQFLEVYLPGQPTLIIRNMPGAQGVTALNHVFLKTKRDGLTVMAGSNSQVNPLSFKKANGQYDPTRFFFFGGIGRGGSVLMISSDAEKRLTDKSRPPVNFGVIDPTRSAAQVAMWGMEYLGWNVRWVPGYKGSADTSLALERGEIDMATTGNLFLIKRLVETGKFKVLNQSGSLEDGKYVGRPEFDAPVFSEIVGERIPSGTAQLAFNYWMSSEGIDKWFALSDGTPANSVAAYREAFVKMSEDPAFKERGLKISEDLTPMRHSDMAMLAGQMAAVTPEVDDFIRAMLVKQGAIK